MEYDPKPPFVGGSPATAAPELVEILRSATAPFQKEREAVARRAAAALQDGS
jgi:cyclohexyl-isocyanide hydratase